MAADAQVLLQDGDNAKALFRRGRAQVGLGRTEEALKDLQAAARLAPEDRAITRELQAAKAGMRKDRQAQVSFPCGVGWELPVACVKFARVIQRKKVVLAFSISLLCILGR